MVKEGLINLDFADVRAVMREMGKAMMGTGEASGEKRALSAAEAAISNPLIDDASMKGARGLLISITGGRDLTLYEVDEAATRIREEVDQDANIIVGATFDEQLEGIIRVSVVATGIDQAAMAGARPASAPEARLAELAQKLRTDQQRLAERVERSEPRAPVTTPYAPAATQERIPTNERASAGTPVNTSEAIDNAAKAAVAAAILPISEDVTIRPIQPKPSLFPDPVAADAQVHEQPAATAFIPPQADRIGRQAPRQMPRIEDLPLPVQNQVRMQQGDAAGPEHPEKRRMGLLQRLASVGLGRRDQAEESETQASSAPRPAMRPLAPRAPMPEPRPMPRPANPRPVDSRPEPVSDYAKRPPHQALDPLGRQAPVNNPPEDDQLEIPAFLRRQAN
jgi:cell division protein FtsZ